MVCGTPFSVTLKSSAFSPSIGLPFLSTALTVSITSCELMENLAIPSCPAGVVCAPGSAGGVCGGRAGCCASAAAITMHAVTAAAAFLLTPVF